MDISGMSGSVAKQLLDGSWFDGSYLPVDIDTSGSEGSLHKFS
jgi:hypothetical protein